MNESSEYTAMEVEGTECAICLCEHDDAIHEATINLHVWFRGEVTKYFGAEEVVERVA